MDSSFAPCVCPLAWCDTAQYVYFFIAYTLFNSISYTTNNIAYALLIALVTKNSSERVQLAAGCNRLH